MVDGTPQGFFQLALLRIMGGQFYLSWHANYNDHTVVCDKENALALLRDQYWEQQVPDQGIMDNASRIDYAPSVELNDTSATVSLVTFSKWGGFLQRNMTFARSFPHVMQNESDRVLIEYNCGIAF
jgi:hypothetical protein